MTTLKEAMNDPDAIKRALEAAHKDQQAMKATPTNKDEELREKIEHNLVIWGFSYAPAVVDSFMQLIDSHVNTKVAEVLDRLEESSESGLVSLHDNSTVFETTEQVVRLESIQAVRTKLAQEEGK